MTGALLTGLAPSAITLNTYFVVADMILISQCAYYNTVNARRRSRTERPRVSSSSSSPSSDRSSEERPLLQRNRSSSLGLPGSHRRHTTHEPSDLDPIRRVVTGEDETPDSKPWLHNTLSLIAVYLVGTAGWFVSSRFGSNSSVPNDNHDGNDTEAHWGLALGYFSALCYLCARIPQIVKNWREKSCEGLALLFFLLSITGNLTYGLSVLTYSQRGKDLIKALPWLVGSLGTIIEDCIIFMQFRLYAPQTKVVSYNSSDRDGATGKPLPGDINGIETREV